MKTFFRKINSSLSRRIGVFVILASTLLSLFTSGYQIYIEYKREKGVVIDSFVQIEKTQLSNIASRVWVLDSDELNTSLTNLLELSGIRYAAVYENGELLASVGTDSDDNAINKKFNLVYILNNKQNQVGELIVEASLDQVYQRVIDRAILILLSNFFKTLVIAVLILFIVYKLVNRHLTAIADYVSDSQSLTEQEDKELSLSRTQRKEDELDHLVDAINRMQKNLRWQFAEINLQRQRITQTLNSIADAVISTDIKGMVIHMNPVAERLTGYASNDAIGLPVKKVFPVYDDSENKNPLEPVIKDGKTFGLSDETTLVARTGQEFRVSHSAIPMRNQENMIVGVVVVFHDVTDQYRLRKELAINEKKYETLTTVAPVGIYYTDSKGQCLFVNEKWSEITGLSISQAKGNGWVNAIYPADKDKVFATWDNFVNNDEPFMLEYRFQSKDEIKWVLGQALSEEDENGNIIGYVGTITDITDRKTIEMALNRSQRMDALGKLTGGISHDYNNMLGVILGYSELLMAKLDTDSGLKEYVDEIYAAGSRGAKLTSKLLSFSRQRTTDSEVLDLNDVLNNERDMLEKTLTVSVNLIFDLDKNVWPIKTDMNDLENAIVNLCINASHAMEGNGDLCIATRNITLQNKDYVSLKITDNGCGISDEEKERIFDPFYTTKGDLGTGLGLSQIYGFVSRANGLIEVESEVGVGTSFILLFPKYSDPNAKRSDESTADNESSDEKHHGNETILVVDDELPLLNLCSEILNNYGYKVLTAESAKQALEILENESVDLLLSDVVMPVMNGYELVAIVKEKYPGLKIQMASGFTGDNLEEFKDNELHKNILHKPYRVASLLQRVRELLDE